MSEGKEEAPRDLGTPLLRVLGLTARGQGTVTPGYWSDYAGPTPEVLWSLQALLHRGGTGGLLGGLGMAVHSWPELDGRGAQWLGAGP